MDMGYEVEARKLVEQMHKLAVQEGTEAPDESDMLAMQERGAVGGTQAPTGAPMGEEAMRTAPPLEPRPPALPPMEGI